MRDFLIQILLFLASISFAAIIPLLKLDRLKKVAWVSVAVGIAVSLVWGGYEFGLRQIDSRAKEKGVQTQQKETGSLQDNQIIRQPDSLRKESKSLKSANDELASALSNKEREIKARSAKLEDAQASRTESKNRYENIIKKLEAEKLAREKNADLPIVLEPTWVDSGSSVQAISGQVLVKLYHTSQYSTSCKSGYAASVVIDRPNMEDVQICSNAGGRASFTHRGKMYWLNLLEVRARQEQTGVEKYGWVGQERLMPIFKTTYQFKVSVVAAQ
jgi:hypothetical protein